MVRKSRTNRKKTQSAPKKSVASDDSITISKTNLWQGLTALLAIVLVVVIVVAFTGNNTTAPGTPSQQPGEPSQGGTTEVNLEGARTIGDEDAPVVFVEYSSFTCPFCGQFNEQTYDRIIENFVETGDVLYVYKHFFRNDMDVTAANAAECAGDQGQFFEYKNAIYNNQDSIGQPGFFEGIAESLGLDMNSWQSCVDEVRYDQKISEDRNEAIQAGIQGTPGFIINGETFARGAQPYNVFEQEIQRALQN